jgi:hypothetical protein
LLLAQTENRINGLSSQEYPSKIILPQFAIGWIPKHEQFCTEQKKWRFFKIAKVNLDVDYKARWSPQNGSAAVKGYSWAS